MNFLMFQLTMKDLFVQHGFDQALEKTKPNDLDDTTWKTMQEKPLSMIC